MKSLVLAAAVAAISSSAFAGGPTVVADDPMPDAMAAPAAAHDWSGPYVGLSYGRTSADITFNSLSFFEFDRGNARGLYAGYLMQSGALVYGGELAYSRVAGTVIPGFGGDDEIEHILDIKGRAGYASNNALFYGVVAFSKANYVEPPGREFKMDGLGLGVGAEIALSSAFVVGLEYMTRDVSGVASDAPSAVSADANVNTFGLRVGLSF